MSPYEGTTAAQQPSGSSNSSRPNPQGSLPNMPPNIGGHPGVEGNPYGTFSQHPDSVIVQGQQQQPPMNMMIGNDPNMGGGQNQSQGQGGFMNSSHGGGGMHPMNMGGQFHNGPMGQNHMYNHQNSYNSQQQQQNNMQMYSNHHGGNQRLNQQGGYGHPMQMQHRSSSTSSSIQNQFNHNHPMMREHSQQHNYGQQHDHIRMDYNGNYHRQPSSSNTSYPHSQAHSHSNSPSAEEEGGLLSYKHPPNFSDIMGLDLELEGSGGGGGYGQQFLPAGLNGDWQSDRDMMHRREMIQHM